MRLTYLFLAISLTTPPVAVTAATDASPEAVVKEMIEKDSNAQLLGKMPEKPDQYMRGHFTAAFNASWANAMIHNRDEPVFDADVITGRQTVRRVILRFAATTEKGDAATVSASIRYLDDEGARKPHDMVVRFLMKREAGDWKVDDIVSGDQLSIRRYFKTSYGL